MTEDHQTPADRSVDNDPTEAPTTAPTEATTPHESASTQAVSTPATPVETTATETTTSGSAFRAAPKRKAGVGVIAALAVGALVGGVSGAGVTLWATSNAEGPAVQSANPVTVTVNDPTSVTEVTAVAAKASPSVVTIAVESDSAGGTGSGVILTADGYILTNAHVVTLDGAASGATVTVTTNDGRLLAATIIGTDPISDLAVIKVEGADLQPAEFADSSNLNVGDTAIAIGAPLGLAGTVTNGIVSALNRSITVASSAVPEQSQGEQANPQNPDDLFNFDVPGLEPQAPSAGSSPTISLSVIQTDAAINPGNSGGALLNGAGEVIGINVAIASAGGSSGQSGSIGVGFAIPANLAQRVAKEIMDNGAATHGLLGASVKDADPADSAVVGASIQEVTPGGAAAAAGLEAGDVITRFDGNPVTGMTDLTAQVRSFAEGSTATVTYVRDGKSAQVDVTLGALK